MPQLHNSPGFSVFTKPTSSASEIRSLQPQKRWEQPCWQTTGTCAPASPEPLAGRSRSIISMTFPHGSCKGEEKDAGPPTRFFLLSVQDPARCETEEPGVVLTTALSSKLRGWCRKPTAALPAVGWAKHPLSAALRLPPDFLLRAWKGLTWPHFTE